MTHITRLQADNFKRLTVIDIRPGTAAGVVPIRGRNAQGKSSTLDAIQAALGGKAVMPSRPVRAGEDEGAIRLELSDGAVILRRFTVDGKGDSITVTNAEGFSAPSPQKLLDSLYASVAFDPLAFTRLDPKAQLQTLRGLVKLDVDVDALEAANKTDYDKRRDVNRDAQTAETTLARMPTFPDAPKQKVDEAALEAKIASAAEHNGMIEQRRVRREQFDTETQAFRARVVAIDEEIEALEAKIATFRQARQEVEQTIADREKQVAEAEALPEPIDVTQAQTDLREARETNRKIEAQAAHVAQAALVAAEKAKSTALTEAMEGRTKQIAEAIERAEMPVAGLSFGDGEVLFGGLPLEQASSAEQLRVSTAIGMASSPKLRVMLVRDGSLLDDEGQQILADLAAANEFQLWVEAVDMTGEVGIVIEDGAVASIDGAAPEAPEEIEKPKRRAKKDPAAVAPEELQNQADAEVVFDGPVMIGIDTASQPSKTVIAAVDGDGKVLDFRVLEEGCTDADIEAAVVALGGTMESIEDMRLTLPEPDIKPDIEPEEITPEPQVSAADSPVETAEEITPAPATKPASTSLFD